MFFPCCSADEILAPAAEVFGVSGGWEGSGGSTGAQSRTHSSQVQHRTDPHPQRVLLICLYTLHFRVNFSYFLTDVKGVIFSKGTKVGEMACSSLASHR